MGLGRLNNMPYTTHNYSSTILMLQLYISKNTSQFLRNKYLNIIIPPVNYLVTKFHVITPVLLLTQEGTVSKWFLRQGHKISENNWIATIFVLPYEF